MNIKDRSNNANVSLSSRLKQTSCAGVLSETTTMSKYRPEDEAAEGAAAPKPKDGAAAGGAALAGAPKMKG